MLWLNYYNLHVASFPASTKVCNSGPPSVCKRNAIYMAVRLQAYDGSRLYAGCLISCNTFLKVTTIALKSIAQMRRPLCALVFYMQKTGAKCKKKTLQEILKFMAGLLSIKSSLG